MKNGMFRKVSLVFACAFCGLVFCGCGCGHEPMTSTQPLSATSAAPSGVGSRFVSLHEFYRAKLVHVAAHVSKSEVINGSCYIDQSTMNPEVCEIIRRALVLNNVQVVKDKAKATYTITAAFGQQYIHRRTYTTLKIVFSNHRANDSILWTGISTVSARGSHPMELYSASLAGAAMCHFQQYITINVNRHVMKSFYQRLSTVVGG